MTITTAPLAPGDSIAILESGLVLDPTDPDRLLGGGQRVTERGQTITLTSAMILNAVDRSGGSWLNLVDDEEGQVQRWGIRKFRRGGYDAEVDGSVIRPGTAEGHEEARRRIQELRSRGLLEHEARAEISAIRALFGREETASAMVVGGARHEPFALGQVRHG